MIHNYTAMPRARMDKSLPSLAQGYTHNLQFPAWTAIFQFAAISRPALQPTQHPSATQSIPNAISLRIQLLQSVNKTSHTEVWNSQSFNITLIICCKRAC